jgi:diketogulonate reductase-like aldo/keto reductase
MAALRAETWRAMEDSVTQGKVRAIGVSNFTIAHLETLRCTSKNWPPAVNQVEFHPCRLRGTAICWGVLQIGFCAR